jgi:bifunctional DNA-binding transcriptional regulator/antitoxin component of YhaV-PrlF toxin-antitoxin module
MINEANFIGKMIQDGRVTVPETIRTALHLKPEDLVQINIKKVTE